MRKNKVTDKGLESVAFSFFSLFFLFGVPIAAVGALVQRSAKDSFVLRIITAAGEVDAISSQDQAHIKNIVEAINTFAIFYVKGLEDYS